MKKLTKELLRIIGVWVLANAGITTLKVSTDEAIKWGKFSSAWVEINNRNQPQFKRDANKREFNRELRKKIRQVGGHAFNPGTVAIASALAFGSYGIGNTRKEKKRHETSKGKSRGTPGRGTYSRKNPPKKPRRQNYRR